MGLDSGAQRRGVQVAVGAIPLEAQQRDTGGAIVRQQFHLELLERNSGRIVAIASRIRCSMSALFWFRRRMPIPTPR